jgi:hypothetical protein
MRTRRIALIVVFAAACGRGDKAADTTRADTLASPTLGETGTNTASATSDPPPPPIDTTGTMFVSGATATATADSANVRFHYDTAGTGYTATFSAADSTTVAPNTTLTSSGGTITGTGRITAKSPGGTIVIDLTRGIASGSSLGKCPTNPASGQGRCGTVTFDSAQFTPRSGGGAVRRSVRLLLGR